MATGVLLVCLNEATKITRFLSDLDKEYRVRVKFGERTDTYDATGRITREERFPFGKSLIYPRTLEKFTGPIKSDAAHVLRNENDGRPALQTCAKGDCRRKAGADLHISRDRDYVFICRILI